MAAAEEDIGFEGSALAFEKQRSADSFEFYSQSFHFVPASQDLRTSYRHQDPQVYSHSEIRPHEF
jgi:hypothetical protein